MVAGQLVAEAPVGTGCAGSGSSAGSERKCPDCPAGGVPAAGPAGADLARFVPTLVEHFTDLHSVHAWTLRVQAKATPGSTRAVGKEARENAAGDRQPPGAGHRVKMWRRSVTAIPQP
ncbi:hypothetical protein GCM10009535_11080 [Streptomyces thermocarboxydovorans]|uniref:Transposase n=1 Tax=Streptomyces thermocarboxydovorans TaxID=59298 RepID=A0ABP3SIC3_9ACTN